MRVSVRVQIETVIVTRAVSSTRGHKKLRSTRLRRGIRDPATPRWPLPLGPRPPHLALKSTRASEHLTLSAEAV